MLRPQNLFNISLKDFLWRSFKYLSFYSNKNKKIFRLDFALWTKFSCGKTVKNSFVPEGKAPLL